MFKSILHIGRAAQLISLSFFLWGIGEGLWFYIQPLYPERLGANPQQIGLALSMMGLGRLLVILPMMLALEKYNPRIAMIPGYICGPVSMIFMVVAPSWEWTLIGFFIYGASAVALIPATLYLSQAMRHDETRHPSVELHTLLSVTWAFHAAGTILSPAIGGLLGDVMSLRTVFGFSGIWFTLSTIIILITPIFPTEPQARTFGQDTLYLAQNPLFLFRNILCVMIFIAGSMGFALVPRFLEETRHYSTDLLGLMGGIAALGSTVWSLYLGRLQPWRGLWLGQTFLILGFVIVALTQIPVLIAMSYFLYGASFALRPLATSLIAQIVRHTQQGFAFAIIDLLYGITGMIAPLIAGTLYTRQTDLPLMAAVSLTTLTLLATSRLLFSSNFERVSTYIRTEWIRKPTRFE